MFIISFFSLVCEPSQYNMEKKLLISNYIILNGPTRDTVNERLQNSICNKLHTDITLSFDN